MTKIKQGLLIYRENERNLGDYIQSLAIKDFIKDKPIYISREELNSYKGERTRIVLNGWFTHTPENLPPSECLIPLFVSFHIAPQHKDILTSTENLAYYKKHEPIGCRDYYTVSLLKEKGIDSYFSGCATLTLDREKYFTHESGEILFVDMLHTIKPRLIPRSFNLKNIVYNSIDYPSEKFTYIRENIKLKRSIPKNILKQGEYITQYFPLSQNPDECFTMAKDYLTRLANAKLVITSRIHTALPCLALGTPVFFLEKGMEHINNYSRIMGLSGFFNKLPDDKNLLLSENYRNPEKFREYRNLINNKVSSFLEE